MLNIEDNISKVRKIGKISFAFTFPSEIIATFPIPPSLTWFLLFSLASYTAFNLPKSTVIMEIIVMFKQWYLAFKESEHPILEASKRIPLSITWSRQVWKEGEARLRTMQMRVSSSRSWEFLWKPPKISPTHLWCCPTVTDLCLWDVKAFLAPTTFCKITTATSKGHLSRKQHLRCFPNIVTCILVTPTRLWGRHGCSHFTAKKNETQSRYMTRTQASDSKTSHDPGQPPWEGQGLHLYLLIRCFSTLTAC